MEIWKDVEGFNIYEVSNKGIVRNKVTNHIKRPTINNMGYKVMDLYEKGSRKTMLLHRIIALHFIPLVEGKNNVNHKDGNPLNNDLSNLEWCTQKENVQHAYDTGLVCKEKTRKHIEYLTEIKKKKVICLNDGRVFESSKQACEELGITKSTICKALKKQRNSAGKDKEGNPLKWEYYKEV